MKSTDPQPTTTSKYAIQMLQRALQLPPGANPFPWQTRLLGRFLEGSLPAALDLPTGLGKTKVMAIWAVARALSDGPDSHVPRRLVYVVDRRAIVDQATREAEQLRDWIESDREAKLRLGIDEPLAISTLRGQFADNKQWLENPSRPAIIVGTVDMVGSRVLFEGYGVSRKMRPYHAALLGIDTLFVLDEAHLVPPFEGLIRDLTRRAAELGLLGQGPDCYILPTPRSISLSATARDSLREGGEAPFRLEEEDKSHPIVKRRLEATKRLRFEPVCDAKALATRLAERAWTLSDGGKVACRILVFCNKREDAETAKTAVEKQADKELGKPKKGEASKVDTALFVGGRRVYERMAAAKGLEALGFIAGSEPTQVRPAFLFATSAAEVGVDLDADHMVCDLVQYERLIQRLGRVNRRGEKASEVYVLYDASAEERTKKDEQTTAEQARARRTVFEALDRAKDGAYDASPRALSALAERIEADDRLRGLAQLARSNAALRPELERPIADAWAMTSLRQHTGRPEVGPWLRGWIDEEPQATVIWRKHFPGGAHSRSDAARKELENYFEAAPPHLLEKLEAESWRVADWLTRRSARQLAAGPGANATYLRDPRDLAVVVLEPSLEVRFAWSLKDLEHDKNQIERDIRGAVVVIAAGLGGLSPDGLLNHKASATPRTPEYEGRFMESATLPDVPFRVFTRRANEGKPRETSAAPSDINSQKWHEHYRCALITSDTGDVSEWLVVEAFGVNADRPTASRPQLLLEHQRWAELRARQIAEGLALPPRYQTMLALAARLHDEGKQALRWQQAFRAPQDAFYAKTKGPVNTRLLDGYRHELSSLDYVEKDREFQKLPAPDRDLVLHMVAAHHGFARPVISTSGFDGRPPSSVEARAREVALRYLRLQDAWGPWGLAWWEALLRAADQWASRDNDLSQPPPGAEQEPES